MLVYPLAATALLPGANEFIDAYLGFEVDPHAKDAETICEVAGRNCYNSFNRPNPATATTTTYFANIQEQGHESIFTHGTVTFYIEASRSFLTEFNTHSFVGRSVRSQRFVNAGDLGMVIPPAVLEIEDDDQYVEAWNILARVFNASQTAYEELEELLSLRGLSRKQSREAARAVLPNMMESPMVVTGNHQTWRDLIRKRYSVHADKEMQLITGSMLHYLKDIAPAIYQDFPVNPFE